MIAFLPTLGFSEMLLLLVVGLLLYGRNLPQAGRTMGRFVAQLKRGFQDFKDQMDRDESLREVRKTFEDTTREMRNLTTLPRAIANPLQGVREFARDQLQTTDDAPHEPPQPEANTSADVADEPAPPPAATPAATESPAPEAPSPASPSTEAANPPEAPKP